MTIRDYGDALRMNPADRAALAAPVLSALRQIPDGYGQRDRNGIAIRGGDLYRAALADRFTMPQLAAARVELIGSNWTLTDHLEIARATATELGRSPDEAGTTRLAADLAK